MSKRKANSATILLRKHLRELSLAYNEEFKFHEDRRWRADFHLIDHRILLEISGAVYVGGRHVRGKGYEADCMKQNHATMLGYRCLVFSTGQVLRGVARGFLEEHVCA